MSDGHIKLPDGTTVKVGDVNHGPVSDATCQKCVRFAELILLQRNGARLCQSCARAAGDKR